MDGESNIQENAAARLIGERLRKEKELYETANERLEYLKETYKKFCLILELTRNNRDDNDREEQLKVNVEGFRERIRLSIESDDNGNDTEALRRDIDNLIGLQQDIDRELQIADPYRLSIVDVENAEEPATVGWATTKGTRVIRYMLGTNNDDPKITFEEQIFCLSLIAWAFALFGMSISVGFLTSEFVHSLRNPTIHRELKAAESLALPALSLCNSMEGIPAFPDFPIEKYPGFPLFLQRRQPPTGSL